MQLKIVSFNTGVRWALEGFTILFRQPLALATLLLMYFMVISLLSMLPVIGWLAPIVLVPLGTVGFMEASRLATLGQTPWPHHLLTPLRSTPGAAARIWQLGAVYTALVLLCFGASALIDDGVLFRGMILGAGLDEAALKSPQVLYALLLVATLTLPLSLLFWFSPALVCWAGESVPKALFFSLVASLKNWKAFTGYGLMWMAIVLGVTQLAYWLLLTITRGAPAAQVALLPVMLVLMSALFASFYPTYRDTLEDTPEPPAV
ncbi:MAG: hypothetical protein KGJ44_02875 [Betaproteobacteria bacterium]|nr:hypothetical protein [Betaproteobacteria bacterium]